MSTKTEILLIEDDKSILSFITASLNGDDYRVTAAYSGSEGLSLAASHCPDVVLLDIGLPDLDGYQVLRKLRGFSRVPVIVLSAHAEEEEKVTALDMGADDYVTKPFGTAELMARIRTSLRHSACFPSGRIYKALDLFIDFDNHTVRLEDKIIHLTQIEYQLLTLLAENSGKVLTYHFIMNEIWGPYTDSNNQILRVNMANIRRKIEHNPAQPQYLFTEVGIGYRMRENENL